MSGALQHLEQAKIYLAKNRETEAETELRRAIAADASLLPARIELAQLLRKNNRLEECSQVINEILKLVPDVAEALTEKAINFISQRHYTIAIDLLRRAVMLNSKYLAAQIQLGVALRESGNLEEAESTLRKAMASNSRSPEVIYELAHTMAVKNRNNSESMRLLMQAIRIQSRFAPPYLVMANIYLESDRIEDAIKICKQCLKANPEAFEVAHFLKDLYWQSGDTSAALDLMNDICNRRGTAEDFLALGQLAANCDQIEIAEKAYRWAATLAPESWRPHCRLAELYDSANRTEAAVEEYKLAIKLNRNSFEPHNSLAMFHVKQGNIDAAVKHLEHACKLAPEEPITHYNLGLVLAKEGKLSEARESLCIALDYAKPGQFQDRIQLVLDAVDKELEL